MAPTPDPIPRPRRSRPYARVEGLRALATFLLLAGFVAASLPEPMSEAAPAFVVSARAQTVIFVVGLATALVLYALAARQARALRRGAGSGGSPRLARALTLACGMGAWALVLAPFTLHGSVRSDDDSRSLLLVASVVVASVFTRIGIEDRDRDRRRIPGETIVSAFRDGSVPPA